MKPILANIVKVIRAYFTTFHGVFAAGALIGFLVFFSFYGSDILDVQNDAWLLNGQDLEQHYVGWLFFRVSDWAFPFGVIDGLAYPYGVPVTFTDSIPLFAITFKIFSPILPDTFQYFGLWGLICFGLQSGIAAVIIRRYTTSVWIALVGSLLVVVTPVLLARMYVHTALASTWLILAAIALIAYRSVLLRKGHWVEIGSWTLLTCLVVLIHPYYLPMVGVFLAFYIVMTYTTLLRAAALLIIPVLLAGFVFWTIGGFSLGGNSSLGSVDEYNLDIASLVNPYGWSATVKPLGFNMQGESLAFMGLGVSILIVIAMATFVINKDYKKVVRVFRLAPIKCLIISFLLVGLLLIAFGTVIRFAGVDLIDLRWVPDRIERYWATFRASARLYWPIYYMIIISGIAYLAYVLRKSTRTLVVLLVLIAAIQVIDISYSQAGQGITSISERREAKRSDDEKKVIEYIGGVVKKDPNKKHLFYLDSMSPEEFFDLDEAAYQNGLTMSAGYFARSPQKLIDERVGQAQDELSSGAMLPDNAIYVVDYPKTIEIVRNNSNYSMDKVGKYYFLKQKKN